MKSFPFLPPSPPLSSPLPPQGNNKISSQTWISNSIFHGSFVPVSALTSLFFKFFKLTNFIPPPRSTFPMQFPSRIHSSPFIKLKCLLPNQIFQLLFYKMVFFILHPSKFSPLISLQKHFLSHLSKFYAYESFE